MPQAQQLDPRDGPQLQNRELLTPERMKGMGDLGQTQRRFAVVQFAVSVPTIRDRALQMLVKMALEPEWESCFEANSYGFRPGRCTMDAIVALHALLAPAGASE